jgi:3-hydroxymyristoyl/3-hydroxydecanoyl-(acyl carrier protein) dehydratase
MRYIQLDRITLLQAPELARGIKCVSLAEDIFADHFPGHPIMLGAMVIESMAQLGGVLLEASMRARGRHDLHALLVTVDKTKFRQQVRPGDKIELECSTLVVNEDGGQVRALARVDENLVAQAELGFALLRVTNPKLLAQRREVLNVWLTGSAEATDDVQQDFSA